MQNPRTTPIYIVLLALIVCAVAAAPFASPPQPETPYKQFGVTSAGGFGLEELYVSGPLFIHNIQTSTRLGGIEGVRILIGSTIVRQTVGHLNEVYAGEGMYLSSNEQLLIDLGAPDVPNDQVYYLISGTQP